MAGADGAGGSDRGGRSGGADRGARAGNDGGIGNGPDNNAAGAAGHGVGASTGALGDSVRAAVSEVASAVKSVVEAAINSLAPADTFENSVVGQIAMAMGMPAALVESRVMDVAYAAMRAANPALALADGLMAAGQSSVADAVAHAASELAVRHGMPRFAANALADMAASQMKAIAPGTGVDVARAAREGFGGLLDKASQEMGRDLARHVAAHIERAVPGATQGLARAGGAAWRAAVESGTQQVLGQATGYLHRAAPALFGNPGMAQLAGALSSGARAPAGPAQALAMRDPNAFIQQGLEQFAARLGQQALQALR